MATAGYAPRPLSLPSTSSTVTVVADPALPRYPALSIKLVGIRKTSTSATPTSVPHNDPQRGKLGDPSPRKSAKDVPLALKVSKGSVKVIGGKITEIPTITVTAPTVTKQQILKKGGKGTLVRNVTNSQRSVGKMESIEVPNVSSPDRIADSRASRVSPPADDSPHSAAEASSPSLPSAKRTPVLTKPAFSKAPRTHGPGNECSAERLAAKSATLVNHLHQDNVALRSSKAVQTVTKPSRSVDQERHRRRQDTPAIYLVPPSDQQPQPEASNGLLRLIRKQLDKYSVTANPRTTHTSRIDSTSPGQDKQDGRLSKREQAKNLSKLPPAKPKPPGAPKSKTDRYLEILNAVKNNKSPSSVASSDGGSHRSSVVKFLYSSEVNAALCRHVYRQEVERGVLTRSAPPPRRVPPNIHIMELPRIYDDLVFMTRSKGAMMDALRRRSEDPLAPETARRKAWEAWQAWHERHGLKDEQHSAPPTGLFNKDGATKKDLKTRRPVAPKSAMTSSEASKRVPLMKMSLQTLKQRQPLHLPASQVQDGY